MQIQLKMELGACLVCFGFYNPLVKITFRKDHVWLWASARQQVVWGDLAYDNLQWRERSRVIVAMCLELLLGDLADGIYAAG